MRPIRFLLLILALAGALLGPRAAAADAAWRAPCLPGTAKPTCTWWNARTTFVADGDTIRVRISGQGARAATIRFTGINAMELHRYSAKASRRRGDCHAVAATAVVDRLIRRAHGRVRLAAQNPRSATGGRLRRSVWVRAGGRWTDVSRFEMEQGLALWLPNATEFAHNAEYSTLAQQAALAKRGLYNPASCGVGPDDDIPLRVDVNWDADGADDHNVNGEWVRLRNLGTRPLSLRGWWLRDSWLRVSPAAPHRPGYVFPASAVIPAGGSIRVHSGCGADTVADFHWCQRSSVFENTTHDARHIGDGAYLFDPQGDLRATQIYPCLTGCAAPLQGQVRISAHPASPETIAVANASAGPVDLSAAVVKLHLHGHADQFILSYAFPVGTVLGPGETMRLLMQGSSSEDEPLVRHLGRPPFALADAGNAVSLRTFDDIVVDCFAWGDDRC